MANRSEESNAVVESAWKQISKDVSSAIFNRQLVIVPTLSAASHFGLFSVFIKKPEKAGQKLKSRLKAPVYQVIGHISQVIQLDKTDIVRLLNSSQVHVEQIVATGKRWEGEVKVDNFFVRLNMEELNKLVVALIMKQGDLYLKTNIPGLAEVENVYIITDVVKTNSMTTSFTDDGDTLQVFSMGSLPIGFGYSKFRLSRDGLVGEQVKCRPRHDGKWEVIADQLASYHNDLVVGD